MSKRKPRTSIYAKVGVSIINTIIYLIFNITFYGLVIFAFIKAGEAAYTFGYQIFGDVSLEQVSGHEIEFVVTENDNLSEISQRLEEEKMIQNQYSFWVRANLTVSKKNPILPGKYQLNAAMNYETILNVLTGKQEEILRE